MLSDSKIQAFKLYFGNIHKIELFHYVSGEVTHFINIMPWIII